MPKLILRCNYLKNAPPSHLANYMNYISTREGVEFIDDSTGLLPATAGQKRLIGELLQTIEGAKRMYEYQDYLQKPTRANASEFISQVLENNLDILAKKKNYIDYLANRPRVEKIGTHGLFSNEGESVVLSRVADEVANHTGVIWTNVISLRREDAERLGYDSAAQWQALLRSRVQLICECYKIDSRNLKWYAAFHNESHHPHVHMVIYSTDPSEGHLTKQGIETMRSTYAHDIFRQEFMSIYEKKTKQRDQLKEQANKSLLFLLQQMQTGTCHDPVIAEQMQLLSKRLMNTRGKKVYGYLKADVKAIVNGIVDELAKEEKVAECYRRWQETQNEIIGYYRDTVPAQLPLSEQKELKSIKNMVIREAVRFGQGAFYAEDEDMNEDEGFNVEDENLDVEETEQEQRDIQDGYEDDQAGGTSDDTSGPSPLSPPDAYADWTDRYKEARGYLYGTPDSPPDAEAAYEIMKEEAESGNAYAMHDMGKIYSQGIFAEKDQQAAQEWYQRALSAMLHVEGKKSQTYLEYRIGKMYQYGLGTDEDLTEAAGWLSMAAGKEHKHALYSLGMLYLQGRGVEQDDAQAFGLFVRSHQKGNPYASYELGKLYEAGRGTEQDGEMADNCYRVAFLGFLKMEKESRDDNLWYRIGCMYLRGIGTERDVTAGEKYLKKASEYGNTHADYMLGKLYAEGTLAAKDMEKALYYLHRAAQAGNSSAQYRLGRIYLEDGQKDIPQAVRFLTLAAEQGNDLAAYRLGKLYLCGEDVQKDVEKAMKYLEQSAESGNQYAQYVLGKLYLIGKDVPQDREKAYEYLQAAAEQGNIYAVYLLEHWDDMPHPDLFLMATRLMHHLGRVMEDDVTKRQNGRAGIDRKLARRIRNKKIAQGHAEDDRPDITQTQ